MKRIAILAVFLFAAAAWSQVNPGYPGVTGNGANGINIKGSLSTNAENCAIGGVYPSCTACTTTATINPANGNRQTLPLTAANTCVLTFTQPANNTISIQLRVIQAAGATGDIAGGAYPGMVHTTVTQTAGAIDFFSCYLDGTNTYCLPTQNYGIPLTALPTFSPLAGTYNNDQSVTITDSQSGSVLSYCTDSPGSCTPGTAYTVPVSIGATGTHLRSTAISPGFATSSVFDQTYTLQAATPSASPGAGVYASPQSVTLTDTTTSSAMQTCIDATNVCTPGSAYVGPVSVSPGNYLRATATKTNYVTSATFFALYASKGQSSACSNTLSTTVTSVPCSAAITVTTGDYVYVTIITGSGLCPTGVSGDLSGFPGGSTVTVLNHCTSAGAGSKGIGLYQVLIGTGGTFTPTIAVPSQTFPLLLVTGFTGLSTGIVGTMSVASYASGAGATVNGPSVTPSATGSILYGAWWNTTVNESSTACTGGVTTCTFTAGLFNGSPAGYGQYNGPTLSTAASQSAITGTGSQSVAFVTGMELK